MYPVESQRRAILVNKVDEHGRSALFYACYHGNYDVMSLLLAAGADGCVADKSFLTPLHYVSKNDDPRMVDLLFLYNKETTKVKLSNIHLEAGEVDLGALAKEDASEDEEEVIGLKEYQPEQEDEEESH